MLAGVRVFVGRTPSQVRTVVDGVAGTGTRSVIVYGPGGPRRLPLGPDGSFITVYAGYVEEVRPRLLIVDALRPAAPARVRPDDGPGSARPRRTLAVGGEWRSRPRTRGLPRRELHAGLRGARSQRPEPLRSAAHARGLWATGGAAAVRADAEVRARQRRTHGLSVEQHAGPDARLRGGRPAGRVADPEGPRGRPAAVHRTPRRSLPGRPGRARRSDLVDAGGNHPRRPRPHSTGTPRRCSAPSTTGPGTKPPCPPTARRARPAR